MAVHVASSVRSTQRGRAMLSGATWCMAVGLLLLVLAGTTRTVDARYLPTRGKGDGVDRLRELLRDVLVADQQPPAGRPSNPGVARAFGVSQYGPPSVTLHNPLGVVGHRHRAATTQPLSIERLLAAADLDQDELAAALAAARNTNLDLDFDNTEDEATLQRVEYKRSAPVAAGQRS